jgi:hypothetical protein
MVRNGPCRQLSRQRRRFVLSPSSHSRRGGTKIARWIRFLRDSLWRPTPARRILAGLLVAWLPLLIITIVEGTAASGVREPFFADLNAQVRLLIALPLLLGAEPLINCRSRLIIGPFLDRRIVAAEDAAHFNALIDFAERLRGSVIMGILILVGSTTLAGWIWHQDWSMRTGVWYISDSSGGPKLTFAGLWYVFVSLNVFRFVLLRWYYRLAVWYRFMWRVSRLRLELNPLHPDRAGGLGFLALSVPALGLGFLAQTTALAGRIGGRILHDGASLDSFIAEMSIAPVLLTVLSTLPLTFFSIALIQMRLKGSVDFGGLASTYVDDFRHKWMADPNAPKVGLVGSSDIQSLADLSNSYQIVSTARLLPIAYTTILSHAVLLAAPFLPLALTKIPLDELIRRVAEKVI